MELYFTGNNLVLRERIMKTLKWWNYQSGIWASTIKGRVKRVEVDNQLYARTHTEGECLKYERTYYLGKKHTIILHIVAFKEPQGCDIKIS